MGIYAPVRLKAAVLRFTAVEGLQEPGQTINIWRPNTIKHCLVTKHFTVWTSCLVLFDCVCMCLIKFERHQTFKQQLKTFLLYSCLMDDLLFVWTAAYQTCLKRACVPHLLSGLYQLLDPSLIKHVLTVWAWTNDKCLRPNTIKHYLVIKHFTVWTPCLVLFDRVCMCWIVFGRV